MCRVILESVSFFLQQFLPSVLLNKGTWYVVHKHIHNVFSRAGVVIHFCGMVKGIDLELFSFGVKGMNGRAVRNFFPKDICARYLC